MSVFLQPDGISVGFTSIMNDNSDTLHIVSVLAKPEGCELRGKEREKPELTKALINYKSQAQVGPFVWT